MILCLLLVIPCIFRLVRERFQKVTLAITFLAILATAFYGHKLPLAPRISIDSILNQANLTQERLFIEITASWCLTCHANQPILRSRQVRKIFKKYNVRHVTLDWTGRQKDILKFMESYNRVGVPFYGIYDPRIRHLKTLPEVITPSSLLKVLSKLP